VDAPGYLKKVPIGVNQKRFVSTLIEVTGSMMPTIKGSGIADVEMTHEFGQISVRGGNQQMEVIGHEHIGEETDIMYSQ
jgi:hypothetical protein